MGSLGFLLAGAALALSLVVWFSGMPLASAFSSTAVLVPLYDTSGSAWDPVIEAKKAHPNVPIMAVINNGGGPGQVPDSGYASLTQRLQSSGIFVLGYTYAEYGLRNSSAIKADIYDYKTWYNVDGIFIDQMSYSGGDETYYSNLTAYSRSLGLSFVMGNPGTDTLSSYVGTVDAIVIYENSQPPSISYLGGWHTGYPKSTWGILPYEISSLDSSFIANSSRYVGFIGIGNGTNSTAWEMLPPYLESLVAEVDPCPSPPTSLSVNSIPSGTEIIWSAPSHVGSSPITGYQIQRNGTVLVNDTMSSATSFNDTSLSSRPNAFYAVAAWNAAGLGQISANASENSGSPSLRENSMTVSSQDSYGNQLQGFYTELYSQNGTQIDAGYTPYTFTLNGGQNYTIHMEDYGKYMFDHWEDTGSDNASRNLMATENGTVVAVYKTVPNPPSGLASEALSYSQVNLSWSAPASDGGSTIVGYKINRSSDGGSSWTTVVQNTGSNATAYSDTGLAPNTTYIYHVFALNSVGASARSTSTVTTMQAAYLTVVSNDLYGNKISGLWVEVDNPETGSMIKGGYTTHTFVITSGRTVTLYASNYQNYLFRYWDDGTTAHERTLTAAGNMTLTAYYGVS